jgi:hypothetical protein
MRTLAALLLVSWLGSPAAAKYLCPPGDFVVRPVRDDVPGRLGSGLPLHLGSGRADLAGLCPAVRADSFHRPTGRWFGVRARWPRCGEVRSAALRARFAFDAPFCTRLEGRLRLGGRRFRVVAERVPVCGNGIRDAGEQCDGVDPRYGDCCDDGCRVLAPCPVRCDDHFPCGPEEACVVTCRSGGVCERRAQIDCGTTPVCACDGTTTYPDRCAAIDAGAAIAYAGACRPR